MGKEGRFGFGQHEKQQGNACIFYDQGNPTKDHITPGKKKGSVLRTKSQGMST